MKKVLVTCGLLFSLSGWGQTLPYQNPELSPAERAKDLVKRLTLEEKALLMCDDSEAIPRLGIKKFNWWSEALHGVANQGNVTVFPEPVGMAASFNDKLVFDIFNAVSDEMRAKHNERVRNGLEDVRFHSLSVWTPNVNIFRDPRWGRGQETYGEDPYLTSQMGIAVVKGLQGPEHEKYRKLLACAKHYAVHSGPEWSRHTANLNNVSPRDLWETYLPAFKALVQKADVREVMCAYQRLDDDPCCGNTRLLQQILRDEWGFKYLVVSDCGAIADFWTSHKSSSDAVHAAVKGTMAGTDVECGYGYAYQKLPEAVSKGLITEEEVDKHVLRLMEGRFELGEMDDPSLVNWTKIPMSVVNCKAHKDLSLNMSRQTMTLLQNKNNVLPLSKSIRKIAVIGPNADDKPMLWGNYNGTPNQTITILDGFKSKLKKVETMKKTILYKTLFFCWAILALTGCDLDLQKNYDYEPSVDDPYVKVTAWEYFQDHKDMFSELIAAIEYTGLKDYYTQTDNKYTFLALNNAGMQLYRENEFAGAASITDCDKEKVTNMLLYHIVDGEYSSYGQLQVEPMFVLTMLKGENGLMTMSVWKNPWQAAVGKILVNQTGSNGKSPQRQAKTSNILPTNGVIHIFENYCKYSK